MRPLNQRLRCPVVSKVTASVVSKVTASVVSKILVSVVLTGTDAQIVRPYKGLHVNEGYTSRFDTTDALPLDTPVHPYSGLHVSEIYVRLICRLSQLLLLLRCISSTHLICTPLATMIVNLPVRPFTITKLVSTS